MIRIDKNKGATILAATLTALVEVFQIRLMLEVPAAAKVTRTVSEAGMSRILESFGRLMMHLTYKRPRASISSRKSWWASSLTVVRVSAMASR